MKVPLLFGAKNGLKLKKKNEAEETLRTLRRDLSVLNPIPIPLIEIILKSFLINLP